MGPYRLRRQLGSGGMGQVWEAIPDDGGPAVALKWLHTGASRGRFHDEMRLGQRLAHPNIVRILGTGEHDGHPWMAMELLEGATLATLREFRPEPWPQGLVLALAHPLFAALEALHGTGVVHRDVKPSNIFLTRSGTLRLIDLGLALTQTDDRTQTGTGMLVGSVRYASPEQARGEPLDVRSDLYSAALVLFELLSGRRVYDQPTDVGVLSALMFQSVPSLAELCPGTPVALSEALSAALHRQPEQRPPGANKLWALLEAATPERAWAPRDIQAWVAAVPLYTRGQETGELPPPTALPSREGTEAAAVADQVLRNPPVVPAVGGRLSDSAPPPTSPGDAGSARARRLLLAGVTLLAVGGAYLAGTREVAPPPGPSEAPAPGTATTPPPPTASSVETGATPTPAGDGLARGDPEPAAAEPGAGTRAQRSATSVPGKVAPAPKRGKTASRSQRSTAATSPGAQPGWLTLSVEPGWARVLLDGKAIGETPLFRYRTPAGKHRVELVAPDGRRMSREVVVKPGAEARLVFRW